MLSDLLAERSLLADKSWNDGVKMQRKHWYKYQDVVDSEDIHVIVS